MSSAPTLRPRMAAKVVQSYAMVASQYNLPFVQGLIDHAYREISLVEPASKVSIVWAPGSFEIPLLTKLIAEQKKFDAILAMGVILQGETAHATLIAQSITNSLQDLALEYSMPVIHAVLLLENEDQARARCLEAEINRGTEAARAAIFSVRTARELAPKLPPPK